MDMVLIILLAFVVLSLLADVSHLQGKVASLEEAQAQKSIIKNLRGWSIDQKEEE